MKIDTAPILLPDGPPPKGIDHPVAGNPLPGVVLPDSLKGIREDPVASGSDTANEAFDAAERDALMHEAAYATRQTIPNSGMVPGLIKGARNS